MEINEHLTPMLVFYTGEMTQKRWPVLQKTMIIGRSSDCDIVLPERQISRFHVRIELETDGYVLRDLGSKNGTSVNGDKITEQAWLLHDGDEIVLANVVHFAFISGEATLPLDEASLSRGLLVINTATKNVQVGRKVLDPPLSPAQFTLLSLLMEQKDRVVSREEVIAKVWPDAVGGVTDQAVDALVYRLRERLEELGTGENYVETIRGHGFRFA
jgi:pSer/pThr/pTyr-binding forkhead associated (FHA) protein